MSLFEAVATGGKGQRQQKVEGATYCTAIGQGLDVGVVVVGHLLVVGAQETDGLVVTVLLLVVPGGRLVAVVGHVLPAGGAQQPEERHLDHADGVALGVHIGELQRRRRRSEKGVSSGTASRSQRGGTTVLKMIQGTQFLVPVDLVCIFPGHVSLW